MKDGVAKGTGDSRYLKSAISDSLTWEQFRSMLRGGTLPIDLNGINTAGWQVVGDALSKANLLPDSLANSLGLTQSNPQVKDALGLLGGRGIIEAVSYVGTNTYGSDNPNSLTFDFVPTLVMWIGWCSGSGPGGYLESCDPLVMYPGHLTTTAKDRNGFTYNAGGTYSYGYKSSDSKTIYWYNRSSAAKQLNTSGYTYYFLAVG